MTRETLKILRSLSIQHFSSWIQTNYSFLMCSQTQFFAWLSVEVYKQFGNLRYLLGTHQQLLNRSEPYDFANIHQPLLRLDGHLHLLLPHMACSLHGLSPREVHPARKLEVPATKSRNPKHMNGISHYAVVNAERKHQEGSLNSDSINWSVFPDLRIMLIKATKLRSKAAKFCFKCPWGHCWCTWSPQTP